MRTNILLLIGLLGFATSCTISKRIDKNGFRVEFNHKIKGNNHLESISNSDKIIEIQETDIATKVEDESIIFNNESTIIVENKETLAKNNTVINPVENKKLLQKEVQLNLKLEKVIEKIQKKEANTVNSSRTEDWVYFLLCLFLPPVAVYIAEGGITDRFWINIILTLLGAVPGIIHAFIVVFR